MRLDAAAPPRLEGLDVGRSFRGPERLGAVAVCAALAAMCWAVYGAGLSNQFVWDDELYLTRNPAVYGGLSLESARWAFTTFYTGNWHPLTWLSHLLDVSLFGFSPPGHHLTSLLLHWANASLVFLVFRRMTGAFWRSALLAALFAVHPLRVESVAWAAERKDVLSSLFWLLALGAWLGWVRDPRPRRYLAVAALYALALLAKPMPVTFPFLLLLLDGWPLARFSPGRTKALVLEKLPLAALAGMSAAVTLAAQAQVGAVGSVPLAHRAGNMALSYAWYAGKTLWPTHLALLYPLSMEPLPLAQVVPAAAALIAATALIVRFRSRIPAVAVGWFWYLCLLVPVIGVVQVGAQARADRYAYFPQIGLLLMAVWGVGALAAHRRRAAAWLLAGAAVLLVPLAAAARAQVGLWRDSVTAFAHALEVTRDNRIAHYNLGAAYAALGDERRAEEQFRAAVAVWDGYADAHGSLALLLERQGRNAEAIDAYRKLVRTAPYLPEAYNNLGALLSGTGQRRAAETQLRQALRLRPEFALAHSNLGKLLAQEGRVREALPHFREAVRLSPLTAVYLSDLGAALAALGQVEDALGPLREALRLDPGLAAARENLDRALAQGGPTPGGP